MQHVFWLRQNRIAGRSGPDLDPWIPEQLAAAGIGAVVSVNYALSVYPDDLARAGLVTACFPMADNAPPRPGDFEYCIEMLPRVFDYLAERIDEGRIPLIHCSAGKDRTGLVLCDYLCRAEDFAPLDAIRELRRVRPIALTAPGYEDFAIEVLTALHGDAG
ncbi:MAG TPA: tyrosine-protein phosphatase [Gammaproteobacteria bacterium]|nr:tyrosine-protein phosphatase [Gammaproteobacteria bacterium]